ncbi:acyl-ACP--UDP-N-acetylglucosamine O-acyltransferase [Pelagicoccus sp. SDUM812003]|uniref:acyl-ACP--UDP-N-acetylglucosamine O-acyltransferase n=1 Tax=Pelagicoccus sp. SDUM812003 TaxID=3041267 RepID=UPI00280F95C5|nr:acyl-ACP--UDP-N-acetylglucosamine O-acyltransferase [Pelagicoccus sp. SDUM812003]MDQ8202022.1 acyl-ACP--UDP-N-acetylglucosamine O-acyltransferase [Pelagicoccus sp. SDUM812003]
MIHPSAVVSSEAKIGQQAEIGPFAVIEADVEIGDGVKVESHAVIKDGARIGHRVTIGNAAVVAGLPQDLGFDPSRRTFVRIGDGTTLREGVTINRATKENGATTVGSDCFLMANSHLGHDCQLGNKVVLANGVLLAGHVTVGDFSFFGGSAASHQFCRIGQGCMVGGLSAITMDVAPFTMLAERSALFGLNVVGLRRRGVAREAIRQLQQAYKSVFAHSGNLRQKAEELLAEAGDPSPELRTFLEFFASGKRGFSRPGRAKD